MNVLVLGATGMLGSMVYHYLKYSSGLNVIGTSRKKIDSLIQFDVYKGFSNFKANLKNFDYVINCIGITKPYCHDDNMNEVKNAIMVNSLFPHTLAQLAEKEEFQVIQISTDCVFSGIKGNYTESSPHDALDVYGKTKSLGEVESKSFLNIRCSIVGPERYNKVFLLEWFLSQSKGSTIDGYYNNFWNGVTTLQFAKLCEKIICNEKFDALVNVSNIHHFAPNDSVNKYELLCLFEKTLNKGVTIKKCKGSDAIIDRTLKTEHNTIASFHPTSTIENELKELKRYVDETGFYEYTENMLIKK